jgi:hypothetical protein
MPYKDQIDRIENKIKADLSGVKAQNDVPDYEGIAKKSKGI